MPGDQKLRPYYDPETFNAGYLVIFRPGVGLINTETQQEITASFGHGLSASKGSLLGSTIGINAAGQSRSSPPLLISSDKNYLNDLEILEYFDFSNILEVLKNLAANFMKTYCRILLSQPLDMVRLILQVGRFDFSPSVLSHSPLSNDLNATTIADDEEEVVDFFQSSSPVLAKTPASPRTLLVPKQKNANKIHPISQHTIDIMSSIAAKDGPLALFRGINASFIHYTLTHTIEAWLTGFLSPFLNIPDPFFLDLTHSTEPIKSLWLSVLACVLTGVVLMPLDLLKVRFMITPIHNSADTEALSPGAESVNRRSIRDSIRHYPRQYLLAPPPLITILTILYQFSTIVFRKSAPYLLFVKYNIDLYLAPSLFTVANLLLLITELFIKLPVENLLRKEQVRFLLQPKSLQQDMHRVVTIDKPDENLVVDFNAWDHEAGEHDLRSTLSLWTRIKKLELFNGWRVGVLNVIGFWGYNIFKTSSVMPEERL